MQTMKLFMDTHDRAKQSFPEDLTPEQFAAFLPEYEQACHAEGVLMLRIHVGYEDGRAFCLNMARDADAVRRAHARVGLPFDSITEVTTATLTDAFVKRPA